MNKSFKELLTHASRQPTGITFVAFDGSESYFSYAELLNSAMGTLAYLQKMEIKSGDHLVFQIFDHKNFITALWACFLGSIIPVPIFPVQSDQPESQDYVRLQNVVSIIKPAAILVDHLDTGDRQDGLGKLIPFHTMPYNNTNLFLETAREEKTVFIQFSSGSTGTPNGIQLTRKNILINLSAIIETAKLTSSDVFLSWLPYYHDMGIFGFHMVPLMLGINQINLHPFHFIKQPTIWFEKISKHRVTVTGTPNFGTYYCINKINEADLKNIDLSSLRLIFNGGEPISPTIAREFLTRYQKFGLNQSAMYPVYGLAEATLAVSFPKPGEGLLTHHILRHSIKIGSRVEFVDSVESDTIEIVDLGHAVSNCEFRIVDSEKNPMSEKTIGHVQIRGENISSVLNHDTKIAWYDTGDIGFIHNNRLSITGRHKDILIVRGQNYFSNDIEDLVEKLHLNQPGKVAIIGIQNPETLQDQIVVFLAPIRTDLDLCIQSIEKIKRHLNKSLGFPVLEILPLDPSQFKKTTSGKIMRFELIKAYETGKYDEIRKKIKRLLLDSFDPNPEEIQSKTDMTSKNFEWVKQCWSEILAVPVTSINLKSSFIELGGDSIKLLAFLTKIESYLEKRIVPRDLLDMKSAGELVDYLDFQQNNIIQEMRKR